ncbi:MAG TPA: hypothetical protein VER96_15330 [Polyangiaceae bacterium]|nr:hypothetical protein [Polyangiaceae bacterium]
MDSSPADAINYESTPLVEVEIEGTDYRLDAGKQGTALCISTRISGSWDWSFGGEARWDVGSLRCKAFERRTLDQLSRAFKVALENGE